MRPKMAVELSGSLNNIKTTNFILERTEVMRFQNCHFNANMNATLGMIPLILTNLTIVYCIFSNVIKHGLLETKPPFVR